MIIVYTTTSLAYSKWPCVYLKVNIYFYMLYNIILLEPFISFSITSWLVTITMTVSSDMANVWQHNYDVTLTLTLSSKEKNKLKIK